ncbi:dethiobiotin synthetase [Mycolicibacterium neoaurum]|uniref:ATP-dependent dethiobiotin synthetase BioD n=1 Tax=Mycolicibacterium neoaurum TaxID=1795 RepID=A0AAV2WJ89_MYCNE|nr:dethiobiotin synthase [Mycolicibacterium neoaurum]TLH61305.1 ATP-dependent dethiobiotin synthetase BioD [Mycolicibacterium neoaurum]CDQ44245.1 dithiobiotin synthetase [Mycolicibacterium neoaurum]SDD88794.1 dethiobiotin synthetase [Mycolicibacterium neoaurum]
MSIVMVTGTDTGVGKTVTTAALACAARLAGLDVAVCKPVQTGTVDGDDDLGEVGRLAGITALHGGWRYPEPLAPVAAANRAGLALPTAPELLDAVRTADAPGRLTIVEGAGGLLVELGADGVTLRDLAAELGAPVLVVVAPSLGTLNHTALTLEALAGRGLDSAGLVVGSWPSQPGIAEQGNRAALAELGEIRAVLPAGAGAVTPREFETLAAQSFDRPWLAGLA